jgi:hypothetical protein
VEWVSCKLYMLYSFSFSHVKTDIMFCNLLNSYNYNWLYLFHPLNMTRYYTQSKLSIFSVCKVTSIMTVKTRAFKCLIFRIQEIGSSNNCFIPLPVCLWANATDVSKLRQDIMCLVNLSRLMCMILDVWVCVRCLYKSKTIMCDVQINNNYANLHGWVSVCNM